MTDPAKAERAAVVAQVAALFCEVGNIGWGGIDRCEMRGACPLCRERADASTPVSEHLAKEREA